MSSLKENFFVEVSQALPAGLMSATKHKVKKDERLSEIPFAVRVPVVVCSFVLLRPYFHTGWSVVGCRGSRGGKRKLKLQELENISAKKQQKTNKNEV